MPSVYIHFPWCLAKCPYCDFVSYATDRAKIDHVAYADAVVREIERRAPSFEGRTIGSVFVGGGTPSLWEPRELGRALDAVKKTFACADDLEVTVECNPTSLDRDRAAALVLAGVNRVSIGTQSLRADQLKFLGRLHDPEGALAAIDAALAARVPRVSTDLIFGMPEQPPEDARDQATALADRGLSHLSCYQLTIEPNTLFGQLARRGRLPLADEARVVESFVAVDEALTSRGFVHYEISNFAKPGEESRHNLGYWRGEEYLGVGCAAVGMRRTREGGVRWRNAIDPKKYLDGAPAEEEALDAGALLRERIMLGLRIATGVDLGEAARDLGVEPWTRERARETDKLVARGRLVKDGDRLRIPESAWLWTDDTAARLF